ncbi:MAG: cyclopropane-fatty-acyl-phospholipid synthase family protein, partial [Vampirovibrio sp.]|nr:cyclopropane-fatty-acyl-phospholipid synthase family protein [Vampirovibrio sp.]
HIQVMDNRLFERILCFGHIGFGEAYVDGLWETDSISDVIGWFILNVDECSVVEGSKKAWFFNAMGVFNRVLHLLKPNSLKLSKENIHQHYDLSNDFFALFLDATMTYSAAKFDMPGQSLESAQRAKYDALCQKLSLKPTDHLLEIGTGWGGFSLYAAKHYGCHITTVTISEEQYQLACQRIADADLSHQIEVRLQDYREITGTFDKIVSIEMVEAVGEAYMDTYFAQCTQLLKKDGLFAIQMITCPDSRYALLRDNVDFIQKHIFPGSLLPSLARVTQSLTKAGDLFMVDLEDMGLNYANTLSVWQERFNRNLDQVTALGFDDAFIRKWNYYLMYCHAAFSWRNITAVQAVYSRPNNPTLMAKGVI